MKKLMALLLMVTLIFSLSGCGDAPSEDPSSGSTEASSSDNSEDVDAGETESETETAVIGDANADRTLVVWSFTDEVKKMIEEYYLPAHPDLDYKVEVVIIPTEDYPTKLDPVLASGKNAPDMFAMEAAFVRKYVESPFAMEMSETGVDTSGTFPYVLQVANNKGSSWQATPGAFFYRRSIAEKYLGVSEPEDVQNMLADWDKFLDAARKVAADSNGESKMLAGTGDLTNVFFAARQQSWIVDDQLVIDDAIYELFETAKIMEEENLTHQGAQWGEAWFAGMKDNSVMGYFLPTWGLHYVLKTNCEDAEGNTTWGDWGMIQGPQAYFWGGTFLTVREGSEMVDEASDIINYLTVEPEFLKAWAKDTGDFISNPSIIDEIKDDFSEDFLAGQNHYEAFAQMAPSIDASALQGYDQDINTLLGEQLTAYSLGEKDLETAINDFKLSVQNAFPNVNID